MIDILGSFSGLTVLDLTEAKNFYVDKLGLTLDSEEMGLRLLLPGGGRLFIYDKTDHEAANYTVLNFVVKNIDESIEKLASSGIKMEHYDNLPAPQDEKEVLRGIAANQGPDIAWFLDPSGNVLSLIQEA